MNNQFIITKVEIHDKQLCCYYMLKGEESWKKCFIKEHSSIEISYSQVITDVPKGIGVIPLICNVLPIIWLMNAELIVDELDETFYYSIPEFKNGYIKMYPELKFQGGVTVNKLVSYTHNADNSAVLFSGGVDAFNTLFSKISKAPSLITLWGADIDFENEQGWKYVQRQVENISKEFELPNFIVHTNFRKIISEANLTRIIQERNSKLNWWHDLQHGIAIIGHAAPITFQYGIGMLYIASSFTEKDTYTCASDPTIDNYVKFGKTEVVHDGYEFNRQMKIHNICNYAEQHNITVPLHVCWENSAGNNCCSCEKCYRTMMGILVEGKNPKQFGFSKYNANVRKHMLHELHYGFVAKYNISRYYCIQQRLHEVYTKKNCPNDLKWFYQLKFKEEMSLGVKFWLRCRKKIKSFHLERLVNKAR